MSECSDKDNKERYLIFDESGNLGTSGRYFVIACIDTYNYKALHNVCLLYTSPSPRDLFTSRMPSSA